MTRLWEGGGELGHEHAEGLTLTGTTLTFDTTTKRTGARSYKFDASAANYLQYAFTGATGRTYYFCGHILIPTATGLPSSSANIVQFLTGGASVLTSAQLTTFGQISVNGSTSAVLSLDTWYRIELVLNINAAAGADDTIQAYLNGTLFSSTTTATVGTTAPGQLRFGWVADPGTSEVIYFDDCVLNDSQGSVNNALVGDQKIYTSFAIADNVLGLGSWTDGAGGTSNVFGSIDNVPPTGVSTATSGASNQIENPVSPGSVAVFTMPSYSAMGIAAGDTITALHTVAEVGSSSTTGTDTIQHRVLANPVVANKSISCDIVAGTYPASWNQSVGTIAENPTVTLGTQPTVSIQKDISTTRINSCCLLALVVSVSPASSVTISVDLAAATGAGFVPKLGLDSPLGSGSGAGFAPTEALVAPRGTATGAGLTPTPQSNAPVPLAAASGAGLSPIAGLVAPRGAVAGVGAVPGIGLNAPVAAVGGAGISPGVTLAAPLGAAGGAGLAPTPQSTAPVPLASASGAGFAPTPQGNIGAPVGSVSGEGFAPTPQATALPPAASAGGGGYTPNLGLVVATADAAGAGIAPTLESAVPVPQATSTAAGLTPTPRADVPPPRAEAQGVGYDAAPQTTIPLPRAEATGAGFDPTPRSSVDVQLATAGGSAFSPVMGLLADLASAAAEGFAPSIVGAIGVSLASGGASAFVPAIGLQASTGEGAAAGYAPGLGILVVLATATGQGYEPDIPGLGIQVFVVSLATVIGEGFSPDVLAPFSVGLALATGEGLSPTAATGIPVPPATADAEGYDADLQAFIDVNLAQAIGEGLEVTPTAIVPVDLASILGVGYDPELSVDAAFDVVVPRADATGVGFLPAILTEIPAPLATVLGEAFIPTLALLVPLASAAGAGLVIVEATPDESRIMLTGRARTELTSDGLARGLAGAQRVIVLTSYGPSRDLIGRIRSILEGRQ